MISISPKKWNQFIQSAIENNFEIQNDKDLIDVEAAINDLKKAMNTGSGQLNYKLAGGCKGNPILQGSFESILSDCQEKKVSYIVEGLQSIPGFYSALAQQLSNTFLSNVSINAFISCKESQASPLHYDFHDLVNIQLLGSKHWNVYQKVEGIDYHPSGYKVDEASKATSVYSGETNEFDVFTIPRGFAHDVSTLSEISLHLAIGLRFLTHEDILLYKARKQIGGRLSTPIWSNSLNPRETASTLNSSEWLPIEVNESDIFDFILSSQKFWSSNKPETATKATFEKGSFFIEKNEGTIKLFTPMVVHPSITIDQISFSPTEIELPIETESLFEAIEEKGELDLSSSIGEIDNDTVTAVAEILHSVGLAELA